MTGISLSAQAVAMAWLSADRSDEPKALAAALRAAINEVAPPIPFRNQDSHPYQAGSADRSRLIRLHLLDIANELEKTNEPNDQ